MEVNLEEQDQKELVLENLEAVASTALVAAVAETPFHFHHILLQPQPEELSNRFSPLRRAVIKTHFKIQAWLVIHNLLKHRIIKIQAVLFIAQHMVKALLMLEFPETETVE